VGRDFIAATIAHFAGREVVFLLVRRAFAKGHEPARNLCEVTKLTPKPKMSASRRWESPRYDRNEARRGDEAFAAFSRRETPIALEHRLV
jgi:hypothetical protein